MTKCLKVKLKDAEGVKRDIMGRGIYDYNYKVRKDNGFLYIPVTDKYKTFRLLNIDLKSSEQRFNFRDLLKGKLTDGEIEKIGSSYEVIGNVAILELDKNFEKGKLVAEALLKTNKNLKTVIAKAGGHEGTYRVQNYKLLAGNNGLETIHTESGVKLKLDVSKVYFTPRLSSERMRIANLVEAGEKILVMFSGIGVYPLVISKHSKAREIYGIEINPDACKYAEENVKLSKIKNIKLFCGDVKEVLKNFKIKFDRIIMPLPKDAVDFLDLAVKFLEKNGIIHLYCFADNESLVKIIENIKGRFNVKILDVAKAGQIRPRVFRYCIDLRVLG